MNLHNDKDTFEQYLLATVHFSGLTDLSIIEKDYYVTYFLKKIAEKQPDIVFKGGTSLSKCHKIIKRFSEDLDINVNRAAPKLTESQRRKLKQDIVSLIGESGFSLENPDQIQSRKDFNRYMINYGRTTSYSPLKQYIVVETFVPIRAFPTEVKPAATLVYDFLKANGAETEIKKYDLEPFSVNVQSIERTFIDKIFAISDYYLEGKTENHSRHIYDLYKLYPHIVFDGTFHDLVKDVREVRKSHAACRSAQEGADLLTILNNIVKEDYFASDYQKITKLLLYEEVAYADAITVLDQIIKGGYLS